MRKILVACLMIVINLSLFSQVEDKTRVNFVLMINDEIPSAGSVMLTINTNNCAGTIPSESAVNYEIGDIYVESSLINASENCDNLLTIEYSSICNSKTLFKRFEIELKRAYFLQPYIVLRIYDTSLRKNRREFYALEDKDYTYEIDSPEMPLRRVRKRFLKEKCK